MQRQPQARILAVDSDKDLTAMIRTLLEPRGYIVRTAYDGLAGLAALQAEQFDLLILGTSLPGIGIVELLDQWQRWERQTIPPVLVIGSVSDKSLRLQLFEAGVVDFLTKPVTPLELLNRVQNLLKRGPKRVEMTTSDNGKIVAFVGVAGGMGTTTICANTAQILAGRIPATVIDAGWPIGMLSNILATPTKSGLEAIASGQLEPEALTTLLAGGHAGIKFRFLSGFSSLATSGCPDAEMERILAISRKVSPLTLVDLGSSGAPFAPAVLRQADMVIIVMALERSQVQLLHSYLSYLDELGVRQPRRFLIANRLRPSPFGLRDIQRSLEEDIQMTIPYEGDNLGQCLAEGRLLVSQFPDSAGAIAMTELAASITRNVRLD